MKLSTTQTLRFFLKHLKREKLLTFLCFFGISLGILADSMLPVVLKWTVDLMDKDPSAASSPILKFVPIYIGFNLLGMLGWRLCVYVIAVLEPKVMASTGKECFEALHQHSYNFFNNEFVGSLVKRVNRMMNSFETFLDMITFEIYAVAIRLTTAVVVLFTVSSTFGLLMLAWTLLFVGFNYYSAVYKVQRYDLKRAESDSKLTGFLADTISNNVNIKLFSALPYEKRGFNRVIGHWEDATRQSWVFSSHIETVQSLLAFGLEALLFYLTLKAWTQGDLSTGDFVLIHAFVSQTIIFTWHLGRNLRRLYEAFANAEEMITILHQPVEVKNLQNAEELKVSHGKIDFKSVHFAYEEAEAVVQDLSFTIKPSEKVALIGPSGGGKTTIVKLILRLFDINKGKILIDEQDISKVTQESLRARVALVPQDPILFHRSLMENIRYGSLDATDEEVYAASKMAHCHEFISAFPKQYKTFVGERGVKLSGGEKQRIAIARAMLSNAQILILDEATSNLDVHSEQLIQEALSALTKNKTTIVIAHRLSTVVNMDRILVIEGGKVVEEGSHQALTQQNGLYHSLWTVNRNAFDLE